MSQSRVVAPQGEVKFQGLPGSLLRIKKVIDWIDNGQVKARDVNDGGEGLLLVYDKQLIAASWNTGEQSFIGQEALRFWENTDSLELNGERLDEAIVHALPVLWSEEKAKIELNYGWLVSLKEFVEDVTNRKEIVAIILEEGEHYGVGLYANQKHILSYTDTIAANDNAETLYQFEASKKTKVSVKSVPMSYFWTPLTAPEAWGEKGMVTEEILPQVESSSVASTTLLTEEPEQEMTIDDGGLEELTEERDDISPFGERAIAFEENVEEEVQPEEEEGIEETDVPAARPVSLRDIYPDIESEGLEGRQAEGLGISGAEVAAEEDEESLITMRPLNRGGMEFNKVDTGVISSEAVRSEIVHQKEALAKREVSQNARQAVLNIRTVSVLRQAVNEQLPPAAGKAVVEMLNDCMRQGLTLEDVIQRVSSLKVNTVTQRQLDTLIQSWNKLF